MNERIGPANPIMRRLVEGEMRDKRYPPCDLTEKQYGVWYDLVSVVGPHITNAMPNTESLGAARDVLAWALGQVDAALKVSDAH